MHIACPSCAAEYEVPATRMKSGRAVRCARCGAQWKPVVDVDPAPPPEPPGPPAAEPRPVTPPPPPVTPPPPAVTATDRMETSPTRSPRPAGLLAAWLLTFLLLAGMGVAAVVWRAGIMRAWPPSSHILARFDRLPEQSAPHVQQQLAITRRENGRLPRIRHSTVG